MLASSLELRSISFSSLVLRRNKKQLGEIDLDNIVRSPFFRFLRLSFASGKSYIMTRLNGFSRWRTKPGFVGFFMSVFGFGFFLRTAQAYKYTIYISLSPLRQNCLGPPEEACLLLLNRKFSTKLVVSDRRSHIFKLKSFIFQQFCCCAIGSRDRSVSVWVSFKTMASD